MNREEATPSALRRAAPVLLRDGIGLLGAGSFVYGVDLMHRPTAFLVAGVMLMALALAAARKSA